MDVESGGVAANNQHQLPPHQAEEEDAAGGVDPLQLATPDPAADYLKSGEIAVLSVLAVVLSPLGALLLGLAFTTIPFTVEPDFIVFQSDRDSTAFAAELASGLVALGFGCACATVLALRCCRGSHSFEIG